MKNCPECGGARHYRLGDGRFKCRARGRRLSWISVWDSVRIAAKVKHRLLDLFFLGVPCYRQRFGDEASSAARERLYRLLRARCAQVELRREPFEGDIECDESTFGRVRKDKRGWAATGKVIVFRLIKHNGCVKTISIHKTGADRRHLRRPSAPTIESASPTAREPLKTGQFLGFQPQHFTI
ncbi:hypothetical protein [Vandammella animalimorsus]|uniref:hypothetical protein n=1 Tax=Vandammella animalimorsus TaxID=2029117 RepID=UPI0011C4457D